MFLKNNTSHTANAANAQQALMKYDKAIPTVKTAVQSIKEFRVSELSLAVSYFFLSSLGRLLNPLIRTAAFSFNMAKTTAKTPNTAAKMRHEKAPIFI